MHIGSEVKKVFGVAIFLFLSVFLLMYFGLPLLSSTNYIVAKSTSQTSQAVTALPPDGPKPFVVTHVETPKTVKAIYMTACVAGTTKWRAELANLAVTTEVNALVIDIKDYSGTVSFDDPSLPEHGGAGCRVSDMKEFIGTLHDKGIYVIGRITVFQDPYYTKIHPELAVRKKSDGGVWKDKNGLSYIDVGAKPFWDYIVTLAKASYATGFDEINFDYVRYPSDGNLADTLYTWTGTTTKAAMLKNFFEYLHDNLSQTGAKLSVDLFGLTTIARDDMGIGQMLENTWPYFDYVDPMVYPSHFAAGTDGYSNPAKYPYQIIQYSMSSAVEREQALETTLGIATSTPSKLRPWLQDFDLGATYGAPEVRAQINATYDVGLGSWLIWDAGNTYTTDALLKKD